MHVYICSTHNKQPWGNTSLPMRILQRLSAKNVSFWFREACSHASSSLFVPKGCFFPPASYFLSPILVRTLCPIKSASAVPTTTLVNAMSVAPQPIRTASIPNPNFSSARCFDYCRLRTLRGSNSEIFNLHGL